MQKGSSKGIGRGKSEASKANLKNSSNVDSFVNKSSDGYIHGDFQSMKRRMENKLVQTDAKKIADEYNGVLTKNEVALILGYTFAHSKIKILRLRIVKSKHRLNNGAFFVLNFAILLNDCPNFVCCEIQVMPRVKLLNLLIC